MFMENSSTPVLANVLSFYKDLFDEAKSLL